MFFYICSMTTISRMVFVTPLKDWRALSIYRNINYLPYGFHYSLPTHTEGTTIRMIQAVLTQGLLLLSFVCLLSLDGCAMLHLLLGGMLAQAVYGIVPTARKWRVPFCI